VRRALALLAVVLVDPACRTRPVDEQNGGANDLGNVVDFAGDQDLPGRPDLAIALDFSTTPVDLAVPGDRDASQDFAFDFGADFAMDFAVDFAVDFAADFAVSRDLAAPIDLACAGPEDCFNGVDDDCNGLADCADPACDPIAECVTDAPGFALGSSVAAGDACPAGYDAPSAPLNQGLIVPAGCAPCTCSVSCTLTLTQFDNTMCPGAPRGEYTVNEFCQSAQLLTTNYAVSPSTVADCLTSGAPRPTPYSWSVEALFCGARRGAGCAAGSACVPRLADGPRHCALAPGSPSCPAGYSLIGGATPWYAGADDTRVCGCGCSAAPGSCKDAVVRGYANSASCGGAFFNLPAGSTVCGLSSTLQSIVAVPGPSASCTVTNSSIGSVTPRDPETLCCL